MDTDVPLATLFGIGVGLGTYWLLVPDWFIASGTAAVYAGAAYFYVAFETSLLGEAVRFEKRADRLGYAIGLFGLSVSPLALSTFYARDETTLPIVVVFVGVIAFLLLSAEAHRQHGRAR